jgi:hypothetical protein
VIGIGTRPATDVIAPEEIDTAGAISAPLEAVARIDQLDRARCYGESERG